MAEAAQGLATPFPVVVKVQMALAAALRAVDPAILNAELRAMAEAEHVSFPVDGATAPLTSDPALDELIRLWRCVPKRQRARLLAVFRVAAAELAGLDDQKPHE